MTPTPVEASALAEAIDRARRLSESDDARLGIVAALVRGDEVIAWGENEVHVDHDPTRHAEIVAITRATRAQGSPDLTGAALVCTLQPCEMCLAALRWAGIGRIVFAARQEAVPAKFFAFGGLTLADFKAAGADIDYHGGLYEDRVLDLYTEKDN